MALLTPLYLQPKGYTARQDRLLIEGAFQAGVIGSTDLQVSSPVSGLTVNAAAGKGIVLGNYAALQGSYYCINDATVAVSIGANATGNPRVDQIVLRVYDSTDGGSGSNQATIECVAGTASSGATLDNRTGAASIPTNSIRLADVLVPASSPSSIPAANVRDRRPWARGAFASPAMADATASASTSKVKLHATALTQRIELSGAPVKITLSGTWQPSAASAFVTFYLSDEVNGAAVADISSESWGFISNQSISPVHRDTITFVHVFTPTAGTHLMYPQWIAGGAGNTNSLENVQFVVEEKIVSNSNNGTT